MPLSGFPLFAIKMLNFPCNHFLLQLLWQKIFFVFVAFYLNKKETVVKISKKGSPMGKVFRPSNREAGIISKIESAKEHARRKALNRVKDNIDVLCNAIASKLIENNLVETTNQNAIEEQIKLCLEKLSHADDFDIDYQIAPYRQLVPQPHIISIYVTSFVLEQLINNKYVVDIFGSDEEIYLTINKQVQKNLLE